VLTNVDGVPMSYVIRDETQRLEMIDFGGIFVLTFEVPIEGKTFDRDNHAVHLILKRHAVGGTAETYIKQYKQIEELHTWIYQQLVMERTHSTL
jgi:hypothetical protein